MTASYLDFVAGFAAGLGTLLVPKLFKESSNCQTSLFTVIYMISTYCNTEGGNIMHNYIEADLPLLISVLIIYLGSYIIRLN